MGQDSRERRTLALVMPVYNEEECIIDVVKAWRDEFDRLGIDFTMILLNDGSKDRTKDKLATFAGEGRITIINKENSGHGPTILQGYHKAVDLADWVFQTDSDNEMKPDYFPELWNRRCDYAALFGVRANRKQNIGRRIISSASRATVRIFFGSGVADVNTPYRLMRSAALKQIVAQIPSDTFAPNVLISGMFAASKANIYNCQVPHEDRKTGSVSIMKWRLWKSAFRSFWQTIRVFRKFKKP